MFGDSVYEVHHVSTNAGQILSTDRPYDSLLESKKIAAEKYVAVSILHKKGLPSKNMRFIET